MKIEVKIDVIRSTARKAAVNVYRKLRGPHGKLPQSAGILRYLTK